MIKLSKIIQQGKPLDLNPIQDLLDTVCLHGYGKLKRLYYTFVLLDDSDYENEVHYDNQKLAFVFNVTDAKEMANLIVLSLDLFKSIGVENFDDKALKEDIEALFVHYNLLVLETT